MKPLWPHTLAWLAATVAALLLALATPDMGIPFFDADLFSPTPAGR